MAGSGTSRCLFESMVTVSEAECLKKKKNAGERRRTEHIEEPE